VSAFRPLENPAVKSLERVASRLLCGFLDGGWLGHNLFLLRDFSQS
jgi:hypothetical protein